MYKYLLILFLLVTTVSCKPPVPTIKDYNGQTGACFLADKCMALNSYTEAKQDCSLLIQKCMKYIDYDKCKDDKDCYDKIWVKY